MSRVLIVDDNAENVYYLRALLESQGWQVDSACQGAEALEVAGQNPPDLVISDLLMPVMDGFALLGHWKADSALKRVPFIVYTATYVDTEDERLAVGMGADDFILKPSEPAELLSRVHQVMAKTSTRPKAVATSEVGQADDRELLKLYSERLVHKLEKKTLELEEVNRALQTDIRQRKEVEAKLRDSESLLRIAGRAAKLGGWTIELPSHQGFWSDEVCAIHEMPAGTQPTAEQALSYCAPEFREMVSQRLQRCLSHGVPFDMELQIVTATNRRVWVRGIGQAQRDAAGTITRVVGAFQDIDEQRKLEEQFRQAQKMEAVGHLAGGVAHDFNNILTVVLGYTELILNDLEPDHALRADIQEIHNAGKRATDLTGKLLAFSRQQVLELRVLDIGQVVAGMETMLRRLLGAQIELAVLTQFSSGKVLGDPGQMEQVLMNLVINARDAMPEGGKLCIETVDVDLGEDYCADHLDVTPGSYVMLAVTDTGCGMPEATRKRVFEPFFTTKDKGKGTGLGLSTVFGIVKQSRGHVWVYSEPERGTTFKLYFPRTDKPISGPVSPSPPPDTLRGAETVLIVEDDESVRAVTSAILRRKGYFVLEARNGDEALLLCEQLTGKLDLLVTDLVMPRMGGGQLAEHLRSLMPELRVLYVSGYTEQAVLAHGELGGPVAFLPKPITPEALLRRVREVLDKHP
jgi:signal transduction histidine kinase/CheY-like chemotaxis protein